VSGSCPRGADPSPPPAGSVDAQILATWRALLSNPDIDAAHALYAIDQLLDQRAISVTGRTAPASHLNRPFPAGTPAPHSVVAEVLVILLAG